MDINEIPRKYLVGLILVMVAILATITVVNPGTFRFRDNTDYEKQKQQAEAETKKYQALLDSIQPDYEASQQLLKKIATEDMVRSQVEDALNVNQKLNIPTISDSELKFADRNDRPSVVDYVNRLASMVQNYNSDVSGDLTQLYADGANTNSLSLAQNKTAALVNNIRGLPVPRDAAELQKSYLATYTTYNNFLNTSKDYASGSNIEPWSAVYGQYAVIDNRLAVAQSELSKLSTKYALEDLTQPQDIAHGSEFGLIKTAEAQWAVVDVQAAVRDGLKIGLARSFAKFATAMLDKLVAHIEKNFAIASQLYYSQDLGRYYSVEYMKKFVSDPVDQDIIQKFLPQYFCVNAQPGELKKVYTAKARANQGADIVIDPNDPGYLQKLARLGGDEKNYEGWWEEYYTSLAEQTQAEAESAATKEVLSPGLKTGRDLVSGEINKTMSSIFNVQEAAISGTIQLGTSNADNPVSQIVAGIVENMVNKFVFTAIGEGQSSGGIGVLGETNVCLKTPQINPIAPIVGTSYNSENSAQTNTGGLQYPPTNTTPPFR